jgi:serine protease Do
MKSLFIAVCIAATGLQAQTAPPPINLRQTIVVDVVKKTKDAVVYVSTTKVVARRISPFGGNDPFWQEFGQVMRVPANSLGSGFIVHPDGYVITNNHVIDRAREINIELADGHKYPADLISADPEADLAVLKISTDKATVFPTIELGDSSDLMIGEPAIAVGNPLGYSHSVSTGIISAVHRDLKDNQEKVTLSDLIQTDAAINPGNSGGPLLNAYGQVIGINTAIRSDAQNIGFAIPVNRLRDLIPELMSPAQVNRVEIPLKLKEERTITPPATVHIAVHEVDSSGKLGAIVQAINGAPVHSEIEAYDMLLKVHAGDKLLITTDQPAKQELAAKAMPLPDAIVQAKKKLGIVVEALTPLSAQKYSLSSDDGLFVTDVAKGSIADKAGLKAGDIIVQLGRYRVSNLDDFSNLLQRLPVNGQVRIGAVRNGQVGYGILEFKADANP